jgi:hypothetical protein
MSLESDIRKWATEKGFLHEIEVYNILQEGGTWNVIPHPTYIDLETRKERELDFEAVRTEDVNGYHLDIRLFAQCKSSRPWVFWFSMFNLKTRNVCLTFIISPYSKSGLH